MLHFHPLEIINIERETSDSVCVHLHVPENLSDEFQFMQGQHLPVRANINGEEVHRTYSICSAVGESDLKIGIRIQPDGVFSQYIANELSAGKTLEVMPPVGNFFTTLSPDNEKTYVAFVAGSGITPILSILKTILATEKNSRVILFYGNRTQESTMFLEELYAQKNLFADRLSLHFVFSQEEQEIDLFGGRLDADKVSRLYQSLCAKITPDEIFICGPGTMIETVRTTLIGLGVDPTRVHSEHFTVATADEKSAKDKKQHISAGGGENTKVTVIFDGHRKNFEMPMQGETILEAARENGLDLPYSCESGVCSTCRTLVREGEVDMEVNYALEDWEVEEGYTLACQARPLSKKLVLDYDQS